MRKDPSLPLRMTSPAHSEGEDSAYASMPCEEADKRGIRNKSGCNFSLNALRRPSVSSRASNDPFSLEKLKLQMDAAFGFSGGFRIKVLGVPMQNAKSRVETQTKLCLQMINTLGIKSTAWSHLRLPEGLVTKEKLRKSQAVIYYSLIPGNKVLDVQPVIVCASDPSRNVQICEGCQLRERKRGKKKNSDDIEVKQESTNSYDKIVLFNCASYVDFSSGDTILPTRITCYCRHHCEKIGFCVYFIARDHNSAIVATGISPPILITDDHKGTKTPKPSLVFAQSSSASPPPTIPTGQKRARIEETSIDSFLGDATMGEPSRPPVSPPNTVLRPHDRFEDDIIAQFIPALLESDAGAPLFENFGIKQGTKPRVDSRTALPSPQPSSPVPTAIIHRTIPGEGPIQGGVEITVLGDNFHGGLVAVFGDMEAVTTQVWGTSTMICILPPCSSPGPVSVTLKSGPAAQRVVKAATPDIPVTFLYKDDLDRSLMELALQVVGLRMTGSLDSARNIAMKIVNETAQDTMNDSALNFTELQRNQLENAVLNAFMGLEQHSSTADENIVLTSLLDFTFHSSGHNLLHLAASSGMTSLVRYLVTLDCDLNARDRNGFTPAMLAAHMKQMSTANILLQAGASFSLTSKMELSFEGLAHFNGYQLEWRTEGGFDSDSDEEDEEQNDEGTLYENTPVEDAGEGGFIPADLPNRRPASPIFAPIPRPLSPLSLNTSSAWASPPGSVQLSPVSDFGPADKWTLDDTKVDVEKPTATKGKLEKNLAAKLGMRWANPEAELKSIMDGFKSFAFLGPLVHTIAAPIIVQRVEFDMFSEITLDTIFEKEGAESVPFIGKIEDDGVRIPISDREQGCECFSWTNGLGYHDSKCRKVANVVQQQQKRRRRQQRAVWLFWIPLLTAICFLVLFHLFLSKEPGFFKWQELATWVRDGWGGLISDGKDAVTDGYSSFER